MNAAGYFILALTTVWLWSRFQRDAAAGMSAFLALAVFLPAMLEIELPGSLPKFTLHRILLLIAFVVLGQNGYFSGRTEPVPYLKWLLLFGLSQAVSLVAGVAFVAGLKGCINYGIEAVLFFYLVTAYLQRDGDAFRLLRGLCYGLAVAAVIGAFQKYSGLSYVPYAMPDSFRAWMETNAVASTYPHRILFGYAMAMGVPLSLALAGATPETGRRRRLYAVAVLLVAAVYYSGSRGPWIGLGLGLAAMAVVGGKAPRKKMFLGAVLTAVVLLLRPGVRDTITDLYHSTFQSDSVKGASYQFRWQLWHVAWSEINRSPLRWLFGYGPVSTETMDLSHYWEGQEGYTASMVRIGYTSWDNNYAADLIELGVIGLALQIILFVAIVRRLVRHWWQAGGETRTVRAGILCACLIFMFAMTNVFIFSPQLKYLFWALAAIGSNASWMMPQQAAVQPAALPAEEIEAGERMAHPA